MEVFAGFLEHVDTQVGRILDELDRLGRADNTLVIYIFGDNGSSAEGQKGSISELLAQNNIPDHRRRSAGRARDALGGLDALGSPKTDNMYHAGWAWAGSTPFHHTKLVASHFGGTRNPMAISWPQAHQADGTMRNQFHHVNDIVPTIYEILGITRTDDGRRPRAEADGRRQPGLHLRQPDRSPSRKKVQYFENNASRGIYSDGWYACAFGPFVPWDTPSTAKRLANMGHQHRAVGALPPRRGLLPGQRPRHRRTPTSSTNSRSCSRKCRATTWSGRSVPGCGLRIHPEDRIASPYTKWRFDQSCTRMPEFNAPGLGRQDSHVEISLTVPDGASGVIYALGGFSGGLTLFMDDGILVYEYNMLIIDRYQARSAAPIAAGKHVITVDTAFASAAPMAPATVTLSVDGAEVGRVAVARTVPVAFTASETFGVGKDLGSPVSPDYFDRRPFGSRARSITSMCRCPHRGVLRTHDLDVARPASADPRQRADAHRDGDRHHAARVTRPGPDGGFRGGRHDRW